MISFLAVVQPTLAPTKASPHTHFMMSILIMAPLASRVPFLITPINSDEEHSSTRTIASDQSNRKFYLLDQQNHPLSETICTNYFKF